MQISPYRENKTSRVNHPYRMGYNYPVADDYLTVICNLSSNVLFSFLMLLSRKIA